jgi:hypothetical protein
LTKGAKGLLILSFGSISALYGQWRISLLATLILRTEILFLVLSRDKSARLRLRVYEETLAFGGSLGWRRRPERLTVSTEFQQQPSKQLEIGLVIQGPTVDQFNFTKDMLQLQPLQSKSAIAYLYSGRCKNSFFEECHPIRNEVMQN